MGTITYFAYGSNMSLKRLRKRISSAEPKERVVLRCHRLAFHKISKDKSGKCDIVPSKESDAVWGRLYHIDDKDKECLCDYPQKLDSGLRWISGWQNGHVMSHNTALQCQELRKEFV